MNILKFNELNEAYKSIIGDKRAVDIVKNWLDVYCDYSDSSSDYPVAVDFISTKSSQNSFVNFIELYEELQEMCEGKRVIYEESNQIRDYIFSKVPDSNMMKVVDKYGKEKIEEFNKKFNGR